MNGPVFAFWVEGASDGQSYGHVDLSRALRHQQYLTGHKSGHR